MKSDLSSSERGGKLVELWRMSPADRERFRTQHLPEPRPASDFGAAARLIEAHLDGHKSTPQNPPGLDFGEIEFNDTPLSDPSGVGSELELDQVDTESLELDTRSQSPGAFGGNDLSLESTEDDPSEELIAEAVLLEDGSDGPVNAPELNRRSERFDVRLEVEFMTEIEFVREHATNISNGGIFISTQERPEIDSEVLIRIKLPNGEALETEARVVHVREGSNPGVGLEFKDNDRAFSEKLRVYFSTLKT